MAIVSGVINGLNDLKLRLCDVPRSGVAIKFQPDDAARAAMASTLRLSALPSFSADLNVLPWLDGAEINGQWSAVVEQTCGVSLEEFETALSGSFTLKVLPADSPHSGHGSAEVDLDPEGEDPPDILAGEAIDLGAYVMEFLSLELDPFPKKPGAVFDSPEPSAKISPFASLRDLKT